MSENTDVVFNTIVDRWTPFIYRGAISYTVPGRNDPEDLVQECLVLLRATISVWLRDGRDFQLDLIEFEKYFKTVMFHRLTDLYRREQSQKRAVNQEVAATETFDPAAFVPSPGSADEDLAASEIYECLRDRLNEDQKQLLDVWINPPEELLLLVRARTLKCLNQNPEYECGLVYEHPGQELLCPDCGSKTQILRDAPSKINQYHLQTYLGWSRSRVSECVSAIRQAAKSLNSPDTSTVNLSTLLELTGHGSYIDENGHNCVRHIYVLSQRYTDNPNPSRAELSYSHLKLICTESEMRVVDFCVQHNSPYYQNITFRNLASRLNLDIHTVRRIVSSLTDKIELIDIGVPLKDIPRA